MRDCEFKEILNLPVLKLNISFLEKTKLIGEGGFGKVYKGTYLNKPVAIKELIKINVNNLIDEISILSKIRHPSIPILYGIAINEDIKSIEIVTEFINGNDLWEYNIENNPCELIKLIHFIDIAHVLEYCHGIKMIHRDIKPANILIDENDCVKLIDFGISKFFNNTVTKTTIKCTWLYAAPEMINNDSNTVVMSSLNLTKISSKVDVWSLGLMMNEIFGMEKNYSDDREIAIIGRLLDSKYEFQVSSKIKNDNLKEVIKNCLQRDPIKRINIREVFEKLIRCLYMKLKDPFVDVKELFEPLKSEKKKYSILNKIQFYLNEFLNKLPIQIKPIYKVKLIIPEIEEYKYNIKEKIQSHICDLRKRLLNNNKALPSLNSSTRLKTNSNIKNRSFKLKESSEEPDSESSSEESDESSESSDETKIIYKAKSSIKFDIALDNESVKELKGKFGL